MVPTGTPDLDVPNRLMTKLLHIYRPRRFHRTCDGTNHPSRCGVTVSTKFGWMNESMKERMEGQTWAIWWFLLLSFRRRGTIARQEKLQYMHPISVSECLTFLLRIICYIQIKTKNIATNTLINTTYTYTYTSTNRVTKLMLFVPQRGVRSINHLSHF